MKITIYTCPMHPEIRQASPGTCPKCGMQLVSKEKISSQVQLTNTTSYLPLVVIIGLILLVVFVFAMQDFLTGSFQLLVVMSNFMAGFFLVFAGFKLLDLKGFAEGYSMYDLLAKNGFRMGISIRLSNSH